MPAPPGWELHRRPGCPTLPHLALEMPSPGARAATPACSAIPGEMAQPAPGARALSPRVPGPNSNKAEASLTGPGARSSAPRVPGPLRMPACILWVLTLVPLSCPQFVPSLYKHLP